MTSNRLEAFTDAIIAIVMTILVLNLSSPGGDTLRALSALEHKLVIYVISFIMLTIYWVNHHHLFQKVDSVNRKVIWANASLIFCLSLFPFVTSWVSDYIFSLIPQLLFGVVILLADVAYLLLIISLRNAHGKDSDLGRYYTKHRKVNLSIFFNGIALLLGVLFYPWLILLINTIILCLWVVPSKKEKSSLNRWN